MSSLWMEKFFFVLSRNLFQMPFPECNSLMRISVTDPYMEKTYPRASRCMKTKVKRRGSMTVEAAIVVPLLILLCCIWAAVWRCCGCTESWSTRCGRRAGN